VAFGCWGNDFEENYPGGDYVTQHRDRGRDVFEEAARVKHLIELTDAKDKLVVDDEPIGAAEADVAGKRSANPARYFAHAVLGRLGGLGSTFHFDAGVPATLPGPQQENCADAFIAGATIVPDGEVYRFFNDSVGGVTQGADWNNVFKLFSFIGPKAYLVALGVKGDFAPRYTGGWRPVGVVAERPGVQVIEVTR
jgi:hypothetical protein